MGLPLICDPSMYMNSVGVHAAWNRRMGVVSFRVGVCGGGGYGDVYAFLLLRCWASFLTRLLRMELSVVPYDWFRTFRRLLRAMVLSSANTARYNTACYGQCNSITLEQNPNQIQPRAVR